MTQEKPKLFNYVLVFLFSFLAFQLLFGPEEENPNLSAKPIGIDLVKDEFAIGKNIRIEVQNNSESTLELITCGADANVMVTYFEEDKFIPIPEDFHQECSSSSQIKLESGQKTQVSFLDQAYTLFGEPGFYRISIQTEVNGILESYGSPQFEIVEPGIFTKFWRAAIFGPMLNALVAILIYVPGHSLALGIIILTLFIRTLLLIPTQKGLRAQKRMQALQPKLEELKKKYADDKTRLAQEQMMLWKQHQINPLSSCLPILIQAPILIGLFYTVKTGLNPDKALFIYNFLPNFSLKNIEPHLFGFDLTTHSLLIFPIIVAGLQFIQMKLSMSLRGDKKEKKGPVSEFQMANRMMIYFMPVLLGFFTTQVPAAVGLYWATSTFYGIIQQLVVNRKSDDIFPNNPEDVSVRIIQKGSSN